MVNHWDRLCKLRAEARELETVPSPIPDSPYFMPPLTIGD